MSEAALQIEHSVEAAVSAAAAWSFWTDVTNWSDPPARFIVDGVFASGTRGRTLMPGHDPLLWTIRRVRPGKSAAIETELDGATLIFEWYFEPLSKTKTRLTQRILLSGENSAAHAPGVQAGFGPHLPEGMKKIARMMEKAAKSGGRRSK
jgi:hypothetical protein